MHWYDDGCDVKESYYGVGRVFLLVLPSFLPLPLPSISKWVSQTKDKIWWMWWWRNLLWDVLHYPQVLPLLFVPCENYHSWILEGTAFLPGFVTSWCVVLLSGLIKLLIILIYNDDDVIVLTRYGLIVVGTKWRHKYKYFGEAIDGW